MSALSPRANPSVRKVSPKPLHLNGELPLAAMRRALLHRPYAMLRTTAFGACLAVSLILLVHRAHLIAPGNQYAVDAGTAIVAVAGKARAGAGAATHSVGNAAQAAYRRVLAVVSITHAPVTPVVAPAASTRRPGAAKHPALPAVRSLGARRAYALKASTAHGEPRGARRAASVLQAPYQVSAFDGVVNWFLYEFPQRLHDECAKAYYGLLDFVAGELELSPQLRFRIEGWMDRLLGWFDLGSLDIDFSATGPAEMFRGSPAVQVAMGAAGGILMVVMLAGILTAVRE